MKHPGRHSPFEHTLCEAHAVPSNRLRQLTALKDGSQIPQALTGLMSSAAQVALSIEHIAGVAELDETTAPDDDVTAAEDAGAEAPEVDEPASELAAPDDATPEEPPPDVVALAPFELAEPGELPALDGSFELDRLPDPEDLDEDALNADELRMTLDEEEMPGADDETFPDAPPPAPSAAQTPSPPHTCPAGQSSSSSQRTTPAVHDAIDTVIEA